jgi:hypothetical protein
MEEKRDIFEYLKPVKSSVPDDSYFENLSKSVIASQTKIKVIPLYKRPVAWISAIAAILLVSLLVVNFSGTNVDENQDPLLALNAISSDELYAYINENIDDFDTEMIVDALDDQAIDELSSSTSRALQESAAHSTVPSTKDETLPVSFDDLDVDDILEYFEKEGIDPEELEEEIFI